MSLQPQAMYLVPDETARVAHAAFPKGNLYLRMYDTLGTIYQDRAFVALFPTLGQPAASPMRLALVSILQFAEGLSDRQAADAVRGRIDWKYLLCLELTDPGFDFSLLSEFRTRLLAGGAEQLLLDLLLHQFQDLGLLKARGRQRTDSTHVLAAVRTLNRLERVGETLRHALNSVAVVAPEWLQAQVPAEWFDRYGRRIDNYQLPKADAARQELAATIGADGAQLLHAIDSATNLPWLRDIPAVVTLRQVWAEQYTDPPGPLRWRTVKELASPATLTASPYDTEARWSTKRSVAWVGYKLHVTEACDPERPSIITHVETTPATTPDDQVLVSIHDGLAARALLPREHLVDSGYTDADVLLTSQQQHGVTVLGPVARDPSWQAKLANGFDIGAFAVDWEARHAVCPAGQVSQKWVPGTDRAGSAIIKVHWAHSTCFACPRRTDCTKSTRHPRSLTLRGEAAHTMLQRRRTEQFTPAFKRQYAARAGVESTHAQALRRCDVRQTRYIGMPKTRLQHILTAAALNLVRVGEWLAGTPRAPTRVSAFGRLQVAAA